MRGGGSTMREAGVSGATPCSQDAHWPPGRAHSRNSSGTDSVNGCRAGAIGSGSPAVSSTLSGEPDSTFGCLADVWTGRRRVVPGRLRGAAGGAGRVRSVSGCGSGIGPDGLRNLPAGSGGRAGLSQTGPGPVPDPQPDMSPLVRGPPPASVLTVMPTVTLSGLHRHDHHHPTLTG